MSESVSQSVSQSVNQSVRQSGSQLVSKLVNLTDSEQAIHGVSAVTERAKAYTKYLSE